MELGKEKNFYEQIGQNIKTFRLKEKLTQVNLASKLKLSRTSVVNIECGRQQPSVYQLCVIAESLNISLLQLLPQKTDIKPTILTDKVSVKGFIEDIKKQNSQS